MEQRERTVVVDLVHAVVVEREPSALGLGLLLRNVALAPLEPPPGLLARRDLLGRVGRRLAERVDLLPVRLGRRRVDLPVVEAGREVDREEGRGRGVRGRRGRVERAVVVGRVVLEALA